LTLAIALAACTTEPQTLGSANVASALIVAADGGELVVSTADHVELAGTRIVIPPNALTADTRIWIRPANESLVDELGVAAGPSVIIGPEDVTFSATVAITLPYTAAWDHHLGRVYRRHLDASEVALPFQIQAHGGSVTFHVEALGRFQGGRANHACEHVVCATNECNRGHCGPPMCSTTECGLAPNLANYPCDDGTTGGPTGRCLPDANGACAWEINWCPMACQPNECAVATNLPPSRCADGAPARLICRRGPRGVCLWTPNDCQPECNVSECGPRPAGPPQMLCNDGRVAGPVCGRYDGRQCEWRPTTCCDDPNGCTDMCEDVRCERGLACDPSTGRCEPGEICGDRTCPRGTMCCNSGCGPCVRRGQMCPPMSCEMCGNELCPPRFTCDTANDRCVPPECSNRECGNQPQPERWVCEDGSDGGFTGRCVAADPATNTRCTWEINHCPRRCEPTDCPNAPPSNQSCPDGRAVEYECRRNPNGGCSHLPSNC